MGRGTSSSIEGTFLGRKRLTFPSSTPPSKEKAAPSPSHTDVAKGIVAWLKEEAGPTPASKFELVGELTPFDADPSNPPTISLGEYVTRWATYSNCSPECISIAAIYIKRVCKTMGISITPLNTHRLLLGALVVATKWRDDHYYANHFYAAVGGVTVMEIARLERAILTGCDWNVHVDSEEYNAARLEFVGVSSPRKPSPSPVPAKSQPTLQKKTPFACLSRICRALSITSPSSSTPTACAQEA